MTEHLRSWVESANTPDTDFPIQNLPYGVFLHPQSNAPRIGVAIGDRILDLTGLDPVFDHSTLNPLMALVPAQRAALRERITGLLTRGAPQRPLLPMAECQMLLPAQIGDYTDFYASIHHATNVGKLFRPDNPLLPNYKHVPIAYHGRASSIVPSGTPILRPTGQTPQFGPTRRLDYELELGFFIAQENPLGSPIPISQAHDHIFGFCLVNDWSARDIQAWEYQPLGPFLGKSFATTISPWVVTNEALAPFRIPPQPRPPGDPAPLPYLTDPDDFALDLTLEVFLKTGSTPLVRLSTGNFRDMHWTVAQMVAHHTSNGCNLRPGDLLASGTISGPEPESGGCLLELTTGGSEPIQLPNGESRRFLEDGDEIVFRCRAQREGYASIGFGECRGTILPALH